MTLNRAMNFEEVFKVLDTDVFAKTQRHLKDVERFILWRAWEGQTYDEMAEASNYRYTPSYLKQDVGPKLWKLLSEALGEEVSKTNFRVALERRVRLKEVRQIKKLASSLEIVGSTSNKRQDLGGAVESGGRTEELASLEQWLAKNLCRSALLLGMERIGKPALAKRFAEQVQHGYEFLVWRSLLHAPPIEDVLVELLQFLAQEKETALVEDADSRVLRLLSRLWVVLQKILVVVG
ncbi:MAG: hypothetical protein IGR93_12405 [Hydrococcus sp. C42_A2020_068]|nr:hypothetical protein [Hydrococcus sp. C42_A2020_068]